MITVYASVTTLADAILVTYYPIAIRPIAVVSMVALVTEFVRARETVLVLADGLALIAVFRKFRKVLAEMTRYL